MRNMKNRNQQISLSTHYWQVGYVKAREIMSYQWQAEGMIDLCDQSTLMKEKLEISIEEINVSWKSWLFYWVGLKLIEKWYDNFTYIAQFFYVIFMVNNVFFLDFFGSKYFWLCWALGLFLYFRIDLDL